MDALNEPYDLNPLMHYKNKEFSKNGLDTIQSKTDPNLATTGNLFLSKVDVLQINKLLHSFTRHWDGNVFLYHCYAWLTFLNSKSRIVRKLMELSSGFVSKTC